MVIIIITIKPIGISYYYHYDIMVTRLFKVSLHSSVLIKFSIYIRIVCIYVDKRFFVISTSHFIKVFIFV